VRAAVVLELHSYSITSRNKLTGPRHGGRCKSERRLVRIVARTIGRPRVRLAAAGETALATAVPAVPGAGPGDPVDLGRGVPQRGTGIIEAHPVRSRDVRPRPAVNGCVGRYVANAEFIGQLPVRQAVRPPHP